jgi:hypothetical protein
VALGSALKFEVVLRELLGLELDPKAGRTERTRRLRICMAALVLKSSDLVVKF